jgi:hypothetical protein
MKKPTRKPEVPRRLLNPSELAKVRGGGGGEDTAPKTGSNGTGNGLTANDDWEAPVV